MSNTRGPRRTWRALALGAVGLALTGCAGLNPGVAVQVGEESIPVSRVDEVAEDFCEAISPQLEQQAQTIAHGYFRGGVVGTLAMRSIADQVAEEHGVDVTADDGYVQQVTEIRRGVAALPEEVRASVIEVDSASLYVETVQAAVGRILLDGEGRRQAFVAAGQKEFDRWVAENGVEFDPSFDTVIKDGTIAREDQALSYAVSEQAKNGLEQQPDPDSPVARELPQSQRCGR